MPQSRQSAFILGFFIFLGLSSLGYFLGSSAIKYKLFERTVSVKGLSEREYKADILIWPIQFSAADNDLGKLYKSLEHDRDVIVGFLKAQGISEDEITLSQPTVRDKVAQSYGNDRPVTYRYTANQIITVYSKNIDAARAVMNQLAALGKQGIAFSGDPYRNRVEYIFTRLNEVKPDMIEEATNKAREVAQKFAKDSDSQLGKIKRASQGQFSISQRDKNNPHIKKVRVVSTVEYYLSD